MTEQQIIEIEEYFKVAVLPNTLEMPGAKINSVKDFVATNLNRLKNGAPIIQQVSFNALVELKKKLAD